MTNSRDKRISVGFEGGEAVIEGEDGCRSYDLGSAEAFAAVSRLARKHLGRYGGP